MKLDNNIAIITGGASGLGYATAEALVAAGMKVALFDLNDKAGYEAIDQLGKNNAMFASVNVADSSSVEQGMRQVIDTYGAIHICVNCAGISPAKKVLDRENNAMPLEAFSDVININLIGTFNVARLAAAEMAKNKTAGEARERGVIINTASVAAYDGQVGQSAYAASKSGIVGLTLPMARDLARTGIRVNTIAPGIMGTPLLLAMPENVQEGLVANIQFPKRMGLPREFAQLVVHMIKNSYLNGETIRLDGAIRMPPK
jgi:NAD(P)-dependent dehydrogenase (short-subunit alcohol dehydrogenase family)